MSVDQDLTDEQIVLALNLITEIDDKLAALVVRACVACSGSGRYDSTRSPACGACEGTGKEVENWQVLDDITAYRRELELLDAEEGDRSWYTVRAYLEDLGVVRRTS